MDKGVHEKEYKLLQMIYHDLSERISDSALNIENFLLFFHKNGYWGDRLFEEFDADSSKLISEDEFIKGIGSYKITKLKYLKQVKKRR